MWEYGEGRLKQINLRLSGTLSGTRGVTLYNKSMTAVKRIVGVAMSRRLLRLFDSSTDEIARDLKVVLPQLFLRTPRSVDLPVNSSTLSPRLARPLSTSALTVGRCAAMISALLCKRRDRLEKVAYLRVRSQNCKNL